MRWDGARFNDRGWVDGKCQDLLEKKTEFNLYLAGILDSVVLQSIANGGRFPMPNIHFLLGIKDWSCVHYLRKPTTSFKCRIH